VAAAAWVSSHQKDNCIIIRGGREKSCLFYLKIYEFITKVFQFVILIN